MQISILTCCVVGLYGFESLGRITVRKNKKKRGKRK
nr:MAG TPA: hypothetical protein [Caudoviricetes sp.]